MIRSEHTALEDEKVEAVTHFNFLSFRIPGDGDCNHEIKRYLFLGRKAVTNLDSVLKSRDSTLLTRICIIKAMIFPQNWKRLVFIPILKKGNAKECSNYHTTALISHASKIMLRILQARLQQYMN